MALPFGFSFETMPAPSFRRLHARQRLLPFGNDLRIVHEVRPPAGLAAALLIAVARATVANAEHMILLPGASGTAFAALLVPPGLQFYDHREHVIQTLVLDNN